MRQRKYGSHSIKSSKETHSINPEIIVSKPNHHQHKDMRIDQQSSMTHNDSITHESIADLAETAAKTSRIAAALATAGAAVAAPTGLNAVGVALGIVSAPTIVTAAPVLVAVATGAAAFSAAAALYSRHRKKNDKR